MCETADRQRGIKSRQLNKRSPLGLPYALHGEIRYTPVWKWGSGFLQHRFKRSCCLWRFDPDVRNGSFIFWGAPHFLSPAVSKPFSYIRGLHSKSVCDFIHRFLKQPVLLWPLPDFCLTVSLTLSLVISWPTFVLLSPALCLECDNGSELTADSLSVVSYAPVHSVRQRPQPIAGAATATVECEQLIGHARYENCDINTLSMTWPDLPVDGRARLRRYKYTLRHALHTSAQQ